MSDLGRAERRAQARNDRRIRNDPSIRRYVAKRMQQKRQHEERQPLSDDRVTNLLTFVHASIDAVSKGTGKSIDIVNMACMVDVSMLLAERGLGQDFIPLIGDAQHAVQALLDRFNAGRPIVFTGPELLTINRWVELHEAQLSAAPKDRPTEAELAAAVRKIHETDNGRRLQEAANR